MAGKKSAVDEYLQTIATGMQAGRIPDIDLGLRVNQISRIIGLDSRQINTELNKRLRRAQRAASYENRGKNTPGIDYGQGRFAVAQREILEVLLNEPKLYETVKQNITADVFDVPIFRQVSAILFETLDSDINASLKEILARTDSVELGNCIMELAAAGQRKGNFESSLAGALAAFGRYQNRQQEGRIEAIEDRRQHLRRMHVNKERENPHNVGMI